MKGFFVILIVAVFLTWLANEARLSQARLKAGELIFAPIRACQGIYLVVLVLSLAAAFFGVWGHLADRKYALVGGSIFTIFTALTWPKAVLCSESGLRQRSW